MIIWRGAGILGVIIPMVFGIIALPLADYCNWQSAQKGFFACGLILGAVVTFIVGAMLNKVPWREVFKIDTTTWEKTPHSLYFIPMQYGGIPWALGGLVYYFDPRF